MHNIKENQDAILLDFVRFTNRTNIQFGVTLFSNGQILSGKLISYKEYVEILANSFKGNDAVETLFANYFNSCKEKEEENKDPEDIETESPPNFIHLKDIKIVKGNIVESRIDNPLRLKLSDVSGFIVGEISMNN
ncbi:hypothetical protein OD350_28560 (plasmid) [Clostridium beijerinckii]|uniref:hypothetical protein n=1 Tax=Clostridium beijerinckii TaxID=1520 RepID=UPI002227B711|nr:hypothetical protein [Clostridium beijerinckii]UYZ39026.1 hypothetical protein OD350_28560 [Clostridium beijerinckii]